VNFVYFVTLIGHKGDYGFTKDTTQFFDELRTKPQ